MIVRCQEVSTQKKLNAVVIQLKNANEGKCWYVCVCVPSLVIQLKNANEGKCWY